VVLRLEKLLASRSVRPCVCALRRPFLRRTESTLRRKRQRRGQRAGREKECVSVHVVLPLSCDRVVLREPCHPARTIHRLEPTCPPSARLHPTRLRSAPPPVHPCAEPPPVHTAPEEPRTESR